MTTEHAPWCDHAHPDTDDGTGTTPCFSRPVVLWPGTAAWLRTPTYPADTPAVIVDNRDGTQTTWLLAEFRQMLWAGIELCATATLGAWPTPDPGPAPERTQAEIEAQADAYARNTISPEFADALLGKRAAVPAMPSLDGLRQATGLIAAAGPATITLVTPMIHKPTVHDDGPDADPRYRIDWMGKRPQPGVDVVLMSVELFEQSIDVLNGKATR